MRIVKYNSNSEMNCSAVCEIVIDEHELGVIDNALYEISKTEDYKKNKDFTEVRTAFHLIREIVNHGKIGVDEVKMAYDKYEELVKYKCWKELEKKKGVEE